MWPYLRFKGRLVVFCSDQADLKVSSLSVRGETSWLTRIRETGLVIMCLPKTRTEKSVQNRSTIFLPNFLRVLHPFCRCCRGGLISLTLAASAKYILLPKNIHATTVFPKKWRLRNERGNSILMTCHYSDLGSASDWLKYISLEAQPMRIVTQIWLVRVISMGFLRSFLESHFAGIPVVASQNVGCFL